MNTLRITPKQLASLRGYLLEDLSVESAAFITAGYFRTRHGTHLTARKLLIPGDRDYNVRTLTRLEISAQYFNRAIGAADADSVTVIQAHTHPFGHAPLQYSPSDDYGESVSADTVRKCLHGRPMGSLLFGPNSMTGRLWTEGGRVEPIDQLRVVGRRMVMRPLAQRPAGKISVDTALYDRQIRAFGTAGQKVLSDIRVGIAGAGGTGSSVAEQLARAGVKRFTLVDRDAFSASNRTRMYGTDAGTTARPKVDIVGENIKRIAPDAAVDAVAMDIVSQEALALLRECDVVFGCTDRQAPRSVLNELAYQFFVPVIDVGVGMDSKDGGISGGTVRASIVAPSLPCLFCSGIISPDAILAESLDPGDRRAREREGYVAGLGAGEAPSVVSLTTMAASYAVFLMKDMLFGITNSARSLLLVDVGTLKTALPSSRARLGCVCAVRAGRGGGMPLSAPYAGDAP